MKNLTFSRSLLGAACVATLLAACGGGGGSPAAAVPAPAPAPAPVLLGMATISGTVTGFGSVIVDGVRIDDKAVAAGKEKADGSVAVAELKIGQHVEVEHDGSLVATKIRVSAEVEGTVAAVNLAAHSLTVLGQAVFINTDAALGPVTVFGAPYTTLADVKAADAVEIHGLIRTDSAGKASLQATRIDKKDIDSADRVNGIVFDLSASAHTFKIGSLLVDYGSATLLPAGAVLANGSEVSVAIPLGTVEKGVAVKASAVKVKDRKAESQGKEAELGGAVSAFDTAAKILTVNGVKVDVSAIRFDQPGKTLADLKPGAYLVIKGSYGADGVLKGTTVVVRGVEQEKGNEVELHGSIADFHSLADFKVRGVSIDATGAKIDVASCVGIDHLANEMQVALTGSLSASGVVKITAVKCEKVVAGSVVVTRQGKVSKVDSAAKTFVITTEKEAITVAWSTATTFVDVDVATLADKAVTVEANTSTTGLQARKVSLRK